MSDLIKSAATYHTEEQPREDEGVEIGQWYWVRVTRTEKTKVRGPRESRLVYETTTLELGNSTVPDLCRGRGHRHRRGPRFLEAPESIT